jgi:hypothetical protein
MAFTQTVGLILATETQRHREEGKLLSFFRRQLLPDYFMIEFPETQDPLTENLRVSGKTGGCCSTLTLVF